MRRYMLPIILLLTDILVMFFSAWVSVMLRSLKEGNAIIGQLKNMIPTYTPNHFKAE
ncbi:MAG: hypothetical protein IKZ43_09575 [Acidaminococcaceae bacterium]|nr:hypothetical protein [Acidaminococcaceae bacterium]